LPVLNIEVGDVPGWTLQRTALDACVGGRKLVQCTLNIAFYFLHGIADGIALANGVHQPFHTILVAPATFDIWVVGILFRVVDDRQG